jgi:hypothetical protein
LLTGLLPFAFWLFLHCRFWFRGFLFFAKLYDIIYEIIFESVYVIVCEIIHGSIYAIVVVIGQSRSPGRTEWPRFLSWCTGPCPCTAEDLLNKQCCR